MLPYSWFIPVLFLPYFFIFFAFCSIFCLFLPYSWLIPALFLRYFWILAFYSIFCLLLAYCCLIRSLYYSCLICALFLYVCFLHPYFAYSWLFSAYGLFAYLCEIDLLHFGRKQQTENSYIFVVGDYFDRLEPCSEISPVCHPWDWWCSILFLRVSSLMVQIFSARNVFQRTVPMTWIMNNLKLWVFWNNDHLKLIPGLFLPYFLMMTDFQNNPGISNYGGGVLRGGCFGSHDIPWIALARISPLEKCSGPSHWIGLCKLPTQCKDQNSAWSAKFLVPGMKSEVFQWFFPSWSLRKREWEWFPN